MKIAYKHLIKNIESSPSIEQVSKKLFQLGHEHEISNDIFDIEFTPNRGDCLSVNGILRDLNIFFDVKINQNLYNEEIVDLDFDFINEAEDDCSHMENLMNIQMN
jgi:phenylalanyl-tRNA synthetase beta subunit